MTGVDVNSKGHIIVYSRTGAQGGAPVEKPRSAQLFEFGPDGKLIREIGKNLYALGVAHMVSVDKEDNIWIVDSAKNAVVKFNPEGRVVAVLGYVV